MEKIIGELKNTLAIVMSSEEEIDVSLLEQYSLQVSDHKVELSEILNLYFYRWRPQMKSKK